MTKLTVKHLESFSRCLFFVRAHAAKIDNPSAKKAIEQDIARMQTVQVLLSDTIHKPELMFK